MIKLMDKNKKIYIKPNIKLSKFEKSYDNYEDDLDMNNIILNKISERKEKVHLEIFNLIEENMKNIEDKLDFNKEDENLFLNTSKNVEEDNFRNYSGEKISIISFTNSNMQTNSFEKEKKSINNSFQKYDKYKMRNSNNSKNECKKDLNNINIKNKKKNQTIKNKTNLKKAIICKKAHDINNAFDTLTDRETLVNNSNFINFNISSDILDNENIKEERIRNNQSITITDKNNLNKINIKCNTIQKTPSKKNIIKFDNYNNNKKKSNSKESKQNYIPHNFSLYDSTSTSNTLEKNKNKFKFHQSTEENYNNINYLKKNETELIKFFEEMNLPSIYTNKFIVNGFDDLNVILILTKSSIAITNQNLKDIGIANASHRAKILIHLEEKAEIIPYYLKNDIIYNKTKNNNITSNNDNYLNSELYKFFNEIECDKYLNNFKLNGYFNIDLLFSQMLTRQPIDITMLKEDFSIDNEISRYKIMKKLETETKNYVKKLKKRNVCNINNTVIYDDKIYHNSCEPCLIF